MCGRARLYVAVLLWLTVVWGRPLQAEKVDAALHSLLMKLEPQRQHLACLGTWVLYHNLRIMIQYLLSGFELELYSMHEYYYIYW